MDTRWVAYKKGYNHRNNPKIPILEPHNLKIEKKQNAIK